MIENYTPIYDVSNIEIPTKNIYDTYIEKAANKYKIDKDIIRKIITIESNWQPNLISKAGARGLMQVMPQNFKTFKIPTYQYLNPLVNIDIGTRIFRLCYDSIDKLSESIPMTPDEKLRLALASYNAGPSRIRNRIREYGVKKTLTKLLPIETKNYLKKFYGEIKV